LTPSTPISRRDIKGEALVIRTAARAPGSTAIARRAGTATANIATASTIPAAARKLAVSFAFTP
jgi:hypothetical protein